MNLSSSIAAFETKHLLRALQLLSPLAEEGNADIIPIPDDVGDGRNDDIVMRQIREAAMQEKDPVLREKLWDEYRRIRDR